MAISFSGAARYKQHNGFSETAEIKTPIPSPLHTYTLRQGKNILLKPLLEPGDRVLRGEKLADIDAYAAVPCISSVSGKVTEIYDEEIIVENDFLDDEINLIAPAKSTDDMTSREILWLMRESGVIEPRTGEAAHVLLSQGKVPENVIVCCFSSDPYVSSQQTAAVGNANKILSGLNIALRLLCIKKAYIAVESTNKMTYSDFKYLLRYNKNIHLYALKPRYPQDRSDILIKTVTGKDASGISSLILSPETLCNIVDAVTDSKPVTDKIVTVSGDDILEPSNFRVPLGASISSLLTSAGYDSPKRVIENGVVNGSVVNYLDSPITASSQAIIAFNDKKNIPKYRQGLI